ncbi:hypothetical protein [Candidatus Poriferisocius sp.]|uniref:hypothetical protein n=1 Tax=Candidatus Poriferisocius sp. TaxID=3101276 RepID=UPI003B51FFD1
MRIRIRTLAIAAAVAIAWAGCGAKDAAEPVAGSVGEPGPPEATLSPAGEPALPGEAAEQADGGTGAGSIPPARVEPVPTSAVAATPTPASPPQQPVVVADDPLACEPVEVHGQPHDTEPADTDGDGADDACVYGGDAEHTHETGPVVVVSQPELEPVEAEVPVPSRIGQPDEGCAELDSGGWDCPEDQTETPVLPTPEPTAEAWGGGGTGWHWDGHGRPVAERVWSQAETASPWPPAGEGQAELDWMTQCMRERQEHASEMVGRGWVPESAASHEAGARDCSIYLSEAWGPVVLDGRDWDCVLESLLARNVRTISGVNRSHTMWDCPTAPEGTDPDPLRPFEARCDELVARLADAGRDTEQVQHWCARPASNPYGQPGGPLPDRDPADPCDSQRYAAKNLREVYWLAVGENGQSARYDWRPC